jgi:DNA-binding NtrC family response regulator
MNTVLVVDDKDMMRDSVTATLQRAGFEVASAPDGQQALDKIAARRPDVVVTDLRMPGLSGIELVDRIRRIDDGLPVLLMTAFGTIETAVKAMKAGAFDYLTKPFEGDELVISVKRAVEHGRLVRENDIFRRAMNGSAPTHATDAPSCGPRGLDRIVGRSPAMGALKDQLRAIANSAGTVLITGESGSGKEVIARTIHDLSPRKDAPFLAVNCAALSESLLESELFGHERGAFTGADKLRKGRFELADGGTLLLDEVSEVSPKIQAKLLRVLQERAFERVGSSLTIGVDVRVIATSNRDLPASAAKGEFRQDLYFRLNVLPVAVPPLRERAGDVSDLVSHFVQQIVRREGRAPVAIEPEAMALLTQYAWPGNVRELQNICERAVVLGGAGAHPVITRRLIEPWLTPPAPVRALPQSALEPKPVAASSLAGQAMPLNGGLPGDRTLEEIERETIVQTLLRFHGHRQKTAQALGIGVRTLGLKLKRWKELRIVAETL